MASCALCKRERAPSSTFCPYHLSAKRSLEDGFEKWSEAYGGIAWDEYIRRIRASPETGRWVKEVAELLTREPRLKGPRGR